MWLEEVCKVSMSAQALRKQVSVSVPLVLDWTAVTASKNEMGDGFFRFPCSWQKIWVCCEMALPGAYPRILLKLV